MVDIEGDGFFIRGEADEESFRQAGREGARAAGKAFSSASKKSGIGDFGMDRVRESFRQAEAAAGDLGDAVRATGRTSIGDFGMDRIRENFRQTTAAAGSLRDEMDDIGDTARQAFTRAGTESQDLLDNIEGLRRRTEAFERALRDAGAESDIFGALNPQFTKLLRLQEEVEQGFDEIARSPGLQKNLAKRLNAIELGLGRETQAIKGVIKIQNDARKDAQAAARGIAANSSREQVAITNATSRQNVVALQRETTLRNAEIRTQAQTAIQSSQRTARTRIELLRFTLRQIQVIERSIGAVFKGTAAVVAGAFARVEKTVFRIGGVFRRGNSDYTAGLAPALKKREGIINRSFRRQEANVRGSVARQSVTIQRFETQASTGIAGALTGRSSLGALFGGGLAIGGGYSLFRKLGDSIQVGGDFIQGLAVLQAQLQLTAEQMAGVRQLSIDLGNDITLPGVSALDAAQAIAALAKQFGALGDAALPAAEAAAKGVLALSRATGAAAEDAAALVGAATNVFGISADEAVATADKITSALTVSAGVSFTDFKDAFTQGAAVFSLFQKDALGAEGALVAFNTALAVLARGGLTGSEAGTGIKQFLIQSVKASDAMVELRAQIAQAAGVQKGSIFFDENENAREFADSIDILRRGLAGFTEEQKKTALVKLFGARASTVAFNLIGATPEDFDLITEAQERQGVTAEVAAAQNIGLRGALDALGSVIETQQIKTYEKWQGAAAKVVLKLADLFQAFFDGTGVMKQVRTAIVGVTVALGALLALKASFELFKFLSIGLTGLISPLGIVVAGTAALGGVIALLLQSTPGFGEALRGIGDTLRDGISPFLDLVGGGFRSFGGLINDKVRPAVATFAIELAGKLQGALARLVEFLATKVVPALTRFKDAFIEVAGPVIKDVFKFIQSVVNPILKRLGQLIEITVVPAFEKMSEVLEDKVSPAIQKVRDFGNALRDEVGPLIAPATEAFKALGDAIGAIAGKRVGPGASVVDRDFSDLSALGPAFQGVVSGIAQSFVNVADRIIEVLSPQIPVVLAWISDQFSEEKLLGIVAVFGRIAKGIGNALGQIAGSPEFLGALVAIAATAGYLAVQFLAGFTQGVVAGLGRTFDVLEKEFGDNFRRILGKMFNPVTIGKAILAALVLVGIGKSLVQTFQRPVNDAGKKVGDGFVKSFAKQIKYGVGAGTSRNQFASGFLAGNVPELQRQADQAAAAATAALGKVERLSTRRLQNLGVPRGGLGLLGPDDFKTAEQQLDALATSLGGRIKLAGAELRSSISNVIGGMRTVRTGVADFFRGVVGDFDAKSGQTIRQGFGQIKTSFLAGFDALRANLKGAAAGVGQAIGGGILAGLGAAISGQQLAQGNTLIGLSGIIGSALLAYQATGNGPVAAAVVGVGLISAAWQKVKNRTREAKEEAQRLVDVYKSALAGVTGKEAQIAAIGSTFIQEIGRLPIAGQRLFADFEISEFAASILDGTATVESAFASVLESADISGEGIEKVLGTMRKYGIDTAQELQDFFFAGTTNRDLFRFLLGDEDVIKNGTLDVEEFGKAAGVAAGAVGNIPEVLESIDIGENLTDNLNASAGAAREASAEIRRLNGLRLLELNAEFDDFGETVVSASPEQLRTAIENLNTARLTELNSELSDIESQIDALKSAAEEARAGIVDLITGGYATSFQAALDNITLGIDGIAEGFTNAFAKPDFQIEAATRGAVAAWKELIGAAVRQGIEDGFTLAEVQEKIRAGALVAISGLNLDPETKKKLIEELEAALGVEGLQGQIDLITGFEEEWKRLQLEADKLKLEIKANVIFTSDEINAALISAFGAGAPQVTSEQALTGQLYPLGEDGNYSGPRTSGNVLFQEWLTSNIENMRFAGLAPVTVEDVRFDQLEGVLGPVVESAVEAIRFAAIGAMSTPLAEPGAIAKAWLEANGITPIVKSADSFVLPDKTPFGSGFAPSVPPAAEARDQKDFRDLLEALKKPTEATSWLSDPAVRTAILAPRQDVTTNTATFNVTNNVASTTPQMTASQIVSAIQRAASLGRFFNAVP